MVHNVHSAQGKAGMGCLVAMAKHRSCTREEILSLLLIAGSLAPRTVPALVGSHATCVEYILF